MKRTILVLLTLGLLAGYSAPLALITEGEQRAPLAVVLGAERPGWIRAEVFADRAVELQVDGQKARDPHWVRVPDSPGLHTATWSTFYTGRPSRFVAHSFLSGRRQPRGWVRKAARLSIAQRLLDDGDANKDGDLANAIAPLIREYLAENLELKRYAGDVQNVKASIAVGSRHVAVAIEAMFANAAGRPSQLLAGVRLTPRLVGHRVSVKATEHAAKLLGAAVEAARGEGRVKGGLLGALLLGLVSGGVGWAAVGLGGGALLGEGRADNEVKTKLDRAAREATETIVPVLNRALAGFLTRQMRLKVIHPHVTLFWRPSELVMVNRQSINLLFDARFDARGRRDVHPSPGAVMLAGSLSGPAEEMSAGIRLDLSGNLVNSVGHLLWQKGILDEIVNDPRLLGRLTTRKVRELLAFELRSVSFTLPPTVSRWTRGSVRLNVGGVELNLDRTEESAAIPDRVTVHGSLSLKPTLDQHHSVLRLSVEPAPLLASCGKGTPKAPLTPCLSDLVGIGNRMLATEGALNLQVELGGIMHPIDIGQRRAHFTARVEPVFMGIVEGPPPSIRADADLIVTAQ